MKHMNIFQTAAEWGKDYYDQCVQVFEQSDFGRLIEIPDNDATALHRRFPRAKVTTHNRAQYEYVRAFNEMWEESHKSPVKP